jgi:Domain of unknown function (DUF4282)
MPIVVTCPSCSANLKAPDAAAGKRVKCPKCSSTIEVPAPSAPVQFEEELTDEPAPAPAGGEVAPRGSRGGTFFVDLLMFRRMLAPWVIMALFWVGVVFSIIYGLAVAVMGLGMIAEDPHHAGYGLLLILGGLFMIPIMILMTRLYCELFMVVFRMNETLTGIKELLQKQRDEN